MSAKLPLLALVLAVALSAPAFGQENRPVETGFSCGLNATYIFLKKAGQHPVYGELVGEFTRQASSDSMLAIKNILDRHGCATVGIRAGADYFLENSGPAIVYLQLSGFGPSSESHFSYLVGATRQSGVELLDPAFDTRGASYMTWDSFVRAYQGVALIPHA
jgi:ABC-type bacteriocin/lantibiotic exporter with double-glycine peptidase domain